jgi:hypothetical protein
VGTYHGNMVHGTVALLGCFLTKLGWSSVRDSRQTRVNVRARSNFPFISPLGAGGDRNEQTDDGNATIAA